MLKTTLQYCTGNMVNFVSDKTPEWAASKQLQAVSAWDCTVLHWAAPQMSSTVSTNNPWVFRTTVYFIYIIFLSTFSFILLGTHVDQQTVGTTCSSDVHVLDK